MHATLVHLSLLAVATAVPGPAKVATDPADLIAGIVLSNHVDAASLDPARVREAAVAGEPSRAAPGVFFSTPEGAGARSDDGARVQRLEGGWLWIRVCSLGRDRALDAIRKELDRGDEEKPVRGIVLDLRALEDYREFEAGARLASLFVPEGCVLFSLGGRDGTRRFTAQEPARMQLAPMAVIIDSGTAGVGEAIAESLRALRRAVIFGSQTAGHAAEYGAAELPSGRVLRVPSRRVIWGEGGPPFHEPVRPDIGVAEVEMAAEMLRREAEEGPASFIAEDKPRPRQNEAALVRGENPELEEAIRLRLEASAKDEDGAVTNEAVPAAEGPKPPESEDEAPADGEAGPRSKAKKEAIRDEALQRALDFLRGVDALGLNRAAPPAASPPGATNAPAQGSGGPAAR